MRTISSLQELTGIPPQQRFDWYIPEGIATSFAIQETGEPLVDLAKSAQQARVPLVFADPKKPYFLRASVADRFLQAARGILAASQGKRTIKVYDAFRPLALQRQLFTQIRDDIAKREGLSGKELWERVTQFIADPDLCPPHSTGGAVDCTLADAASGAEVPMGTPIDTIGDLASTMADGISPEHRANRLQLFSSLIAAGFANLATEWWHYSYGDQYWAIFYGHAAATYGSLEAEPS